ncbi:urokinase plasminogen activator surface receptor-like [Pseudoliparis swirei]|uniref:urokinase plasminogen activator surface receptor-like n=1 Tax=Pseudoliparis swirei TaxID=2059687 RepID=UPI0024BD7452|nr:urokinase plasminogen activator surface receptor-like [Pseudoliparis swirei]
MHLLTLIFGIVLLPKAHTLKCYECAAGTPENCKVSECPSTGQQCSALRLTSYAGGSKLVDVKSKRCALTAECVEASLNFGISKVLINSMCCNADLCNQKIALVSIQSIPNGNKCFQCKGKECTATLNCEGTEDHCISAKMNLGGESVTMKGCASKLMCLPETKKTSGFMSAEISCCQGNFCNSAGSTRAGLLLLAAPLVSLVVLS